MKPTKAVLETVAARVLEDSAMIFAMPRTEPAAEFFSRPDIGATGNDAPLPPAREGYPSGSDIPLISQQDQGDEELWTFDKSGTTAGNPSPETGSGDSSAQQIFGVQVSFAGYASGYCELWASKEIAKMIASNMLGLFDDNCDTINQVCLDALKETLNILCGNILTECAGSEPIFNLDPPNSLHLAVALPRSEYAAEAWLEIDNQPALFRMVVDETSIAA